MTALIHAQNLHKRYKIGGQPLHVLRGVDLHVDAGQWLAVVGASGCGKSTLLHLLGGLDRPDEGDVTFQDQKIFQFRGGQLDRYRNRHVGFVFQSYHLLPELNALDNVLIAAMIQTSIWRWPMQRGTLRAKAGQLLERLGLGGRLKHRPSKLSGGERQRVAIARALINSPDVLLADEPTGNLDADTGSQILDVFKEFHHAGQTIVMVTHDPQIAAYADRTVRLHSGRLTGPAAA